jgi:hypothetical protein
MNDSVVYLTNGHEESPVPGWYFVNEASVYEGPYLNKTLAQEAFDWYYTIYLNGPKGK